MVTKAWSSLHPQRQLLQRPPLLPLRQLRLVLLVRRVLPRQLHLHLHLHL